MKKTLQIIGAITLTIAQSSQADVIKMKNGLELQGTLVSANAREVVFLGANGIQATYAVTQVTSITFVPPPPPPQPKPAPPPAPPASAAVMTVPAGTQVVVRTIDAIDGNTARAGARYRATIDDPVMVGSQTAVPRGANCTLEVVELQQGQGVALRLRDINVAGKVYSTSTEYAEVEATGTSKSKKAVRRGVGLGAVGAGIGAMAGGGSGAAIGAVVGGGVGAASAAASKGKQINVPTESRLIFALKAPVPMN